METLLFHLMRILRIFPTATKATPDDDLALRGRRLPTVNDLDRDGIDEVHISVTFTWDIPWAEAAARHWEQIAPVGVGGPAYNEPGGDFVPGMYMKRGYVITSRGCPNRCAFCAVPKREGGVLRELPVTDGWIVTDDNLLACSTTHINDVFEMLKRQPHRPQFTGGLEAALLTPGMATRLKELRPERLFFAYDSPAELEPLVEAGRMLLDAGFTRASHDLRCYVLIGYDRHDTFDKCIRRFGEAYRAGFMPMAMLYRDQKGDYAKDWRDFQREWANPIITAANCKKHFEME
jgi:hypothetical protein